MFFYLSENYNLNYEKSLKTPVVEALEKEKENFP